MLCKLEIADLVFPLLHFQSNIQSEMEFSRIKIFLSEYFKPKQCRTKIKSIVPLMLGRCLENEGLFESCLGCSPRA